MIDKTTFEMISLPKLRWQQYSLTSSGTPGTELTLSRPAIAVSSMTKSGRVITVTTAAAHHLFKDQRVTISGAVEAEYNGEWSVDAVTSSTEFTFKFAIGNNDNPASPATGTVLASVTPMAQQVLLKADGGNDTDPANYVSFGPNAGADFDTIGPDGVYKLEAPRGARFNLANWYFKSAAASQVLRVLYI